MSDTSKHILPSGPPLAGEERSETTVISFRGDEDTLAAIEVLTSRFAANIDDNISRKKIRAAAIRKALIEAADMKPTAKRKR